MAKLYFRYGAMNSGKSTALMQVAHNYEELGMRVLVLKPSLDTKGRAASGFPSGCNPSGGFLYFLGNRCVGNRPAMQHALFSPLLRSV